MVSIQRAEKVMPPSINPKIAAPRFLNQCERAPTDFAQFREHDLFFPQEFRIDRDGRFHPNYPNFRERKRRSEEHTSELQSLTNLVCRLLLEIRRAHV